MTFDLSRIDFILWSELLPTLSSEIVLWGANCTGTFCLTMETYRSPKYFPKNVKITFNAYRSSYNHLNLRYFQVFWYAKPCLWASGSRSFQTSRPTLPQPYLYISEDFNSSSASFNALVPKVLKRLGECD